MSQPTYLDHIGDMQEKIHAVIGPLMGASAFAMVDFPDIRNVGDSAIWLGEIAYLRDRLGKGPSYVSKSWDHSDDDLAERVPQGPILLQGGGTFGDIWTGHQKLRLRIMKRWKGRPIIQLPQSIHYDSKDATDEMARAIADHGNVTLLLRDQPSVDFALKHFDCTALLCPDMAFGIGAIKAPPGDLPVLAMLRDDREKSSALGAAELKDVPVEDWIFTERKLAVQFAKAAGLAQGLSTFDRIGMRFAKYNAAANQRLSRGIRQLSRARAIVTDRLHVHIISTLMGRPHAVLDNSYGKITRFMEAFPGGMDVTYRAKSLADGLEWARAQAQAAPTTTGKQGAAL